MWLHATSRPADSSELAGRQGDHMTQETDEILEMTENPEDVLQEEGIEVEQPA